MKNKTLKTDYTEFDSINELSVEHQQLLRKAIESAQTAYAPYSNFKVGSAVLLENGEIVCGSNQENAAYPSGLCAERVALFYSGAHFPGVKIKSIAVTAFPPDETEPAAVSPCGDCRQVMAEYEHRYARNIELIMMGANGKVLVFNNVTELLPFMFNPDNLLV